MRIPQFPLHSVLKSLCLIVFCLTPFALNAQVVADFTASDTIGCTPLKVEFTNTGSTGGDYSYAWDFGVIGNSELENPEFEYLNGGEQEVTLVVTDTVTLESATITKNIVIYFTPSANVTIDETNSCVNGIIKFNASGSSIDNAYWDFGDGSSLNTQSFFNFHSYSSNGTYDAVYIPSYKMCSDTGNFSIEISGPVASINISPEEACMGTPVEFSINEVSDVVAYDWELGEGDFQTGSPVYHSYDIMGRQLVLLNLEGSDKNCTIQDTFYLHEVVAAINVPEVRCDQNELFLENISIGNSNNFWYYGTDGVSITEHLSMTFAAGTYPIKLKVVHAEGCGDSTEIELIVNNLPVVSVSTDIGTICPGDEATLRANGGDVISWEPILGLDDPSSLVTAASPDTNTTYTALVTNSTTGCANRDSISILVQKGFIEGQIHVAPFDTSYIVGESLQVRFTDSLSRTLSYSWTPDYMISCTDCPDPLLQALETTTYILEVTDTNLCNASEQFEISIQVTEEYQLGVPEAFTPNGDEVNDIIKVDGWGIKNLLEFRVFNRSGSEVFLSTDIDSGWDGTYKDTPQATGTYLYVIKAELWDDSVKTINGTFSLLR